MKIFLDTADVAIVHKWAELGIVDGVTTNPTHLMKQGGDPRAVISQICALLPQGEISVEVTHKEPDLVYRQAHDIASISPTILVKIPCHVDYYPIIKKLVAEGIRLNITLVFSLIQSMFMSKMGVEYISPFVGRLDDSGEFGIDLIYEIRAMLDEYQFGTKALVASVRNVEHVHDAILAGADAITMPPEILEKVVSHSLTEKGMATFLQDWQKLGWLQFP